MDLKNGVMPKTLGATTEMSPSPQKAPGFLPLGIPGSFFIVIKN